MTPRVMTKIAIDMEDTDLSTDNLTATEKLSCRELDVYRLIAQGKRGREICSDLGITDATLKSHKRNLMKKLDLSSTPELMHFALKNKLFSN
jgi:DNA-binding NarL/FixJ family response regulator